MMCASFLTRLFACVFFLGQVRLAKEAQEAARTALQLEPQNDLAHHLMGRWHFEMAQINFVVRQLIRLVYGAALAPGKFEDALAEFEAAVALNPHKLIHRLGASQGKGEGGTSATLSGRQQDAVRVRQVGRHAGVEPGADERGKIVVTSVLLIPLPGDVFRRCW